MKRVLALVLALTASSVLQADIVELKNGQKVDGAFRQANAAGVSVEVGGQVLTFPLDQVKAIYFGNAPATTAASSGTAANGSSEALNSLRGLESVLKSGVNYQEFSRRVLDARVVVDKSLAPDEAPKLREAMQIYELVARTWSIRISRQLGSIESVLTDPAIRSCPQAVDAAKAAVTETARITAARTKKPVEEPTPLMIGLYFVGDSRGVIQDFGTQPLIACASERLH